MRYYFRIAGTVSACGRLACRRIVGPGGRIFQRAVSFFFEFMLTFKALKPNFMIKSPQRISEKQNTMWPRVGVYAAFGAVPGKVEPPVSACGKCEPFGYFIADST